MYLTSTNTETEVLVRVSQLHKGLTTQDSFMLKLILTEAPDLGARSEDERTYQFNQVPVRIGRGADNEIILTDPTRTVSRNHAVIFAENGDVLIKDLESKNLTFLNNEQLIPGQPLALKDGDSIHCGDFILQVLLQEDSTVDDLTQKTPEFTVIDTAVHFEAGLFNPFEEIVSDFFDLLKQLTDTYQDATPELRDSLLAQAIMKSTKGMESSEVVQVIAESLSNTGLLKKDLGIPSENEKGV